MTKEDLHSFCPSKESEEAKNDENEKPSTYTLN
jgi:hypothetical protein